MLSDPDKTALLIPFPSRAGQVSFFADKLRVIERARLLLVRYGWVQGNDSSARGFNLDEAIKEAAKQTSREGLICDPTTAERRAMMVAAIFADAGEIDYPWPYVVRWNDQPARTEDEVFVLLDEVLEYERDALIRTMRLVSSSSSAG